MKESLFKVKVETDAENYIFTTSGKNLIGLLNPNYYDEDELGKIKDFIKTSKEDDEFITDDESLVITTMDLKDNY